MPFLELEKVSFRYPKGKEVLQELTLLLKEGAFVALLGPNGAGKTTLLKLLAGIYTPTQGNICLLNTRVKLQEGGERLVAYVPQFLYVPIELRVIDFVLLGRTGGKSLRGRIRALDASRAFEALEKVGIPTLWKKDLGQLSGGERQKVLLAKALAQDTPLLLLDEPVTHLDLRNQVEILHLLQTLVQKEGKKILAVMHEVNYALWFADTTILLKEGRIYRAGNSKEILTPPTVQEVFGQLVEDRGGWLVPIIGGGSPSV
ncbi:MAG: ABC transporter ATP-binding protein [Spirochaetales bacterium]